MQHIKPIFLFIPPIRRQPAFAFLEAEVFAFRVVFHLVFVDGADLEVSGFGVAEVEAGDCGAGSHGKAAGEGGAGVYSTDRMFSQEKYKKKWIYVHFFLDTMISF